MDKFTEQFCKIVDGHAKYMICSGFAAISSGRSRGTEDIDLIIEKIALERFSILHLDLINNGFECFQSESAEKIYNLYLKKGDSVRYVWKGTHLPEMELKFAKDELDEIQIENRIQMPLTGLKVFFAPIEGNIVYKEEFLKAEKDFEDAKHLRIVYAEQIDEEKIKYYKELVRRLR